MILHGFSGKAISRSLLYMCVRRGRKSKSQTVRRLLQTEDWCHLPNVHFFRDGLVAYDLRSHPGHRPREGHLGALVAELFGRAEVRNLHRVVVGDQHAGTMSAHVYNPDATCIVRMLKVNANQVGQTADATKREDEGLQ